MLSELLLIFARCLVVYVGGIIYFLPSIVTARRGEASFSTFYLNFMFGWTVIGWFVQLAWLYIRKHAQPPAQKHPVPDDPAIDIEPIVLHCGGALCLSIALAFLAYLIGQAA